MLRLVLTLWTHIQTPEVSDHTFAVSALQTDLRPITWVIFVVALMFARASWRRKFDDLALLAATVTFALLGNAVICGVISGPHDRYGARMVWVATFVVLMALSRLLSAEPADAPQPRRDRKSSTPVL